MCIYIYIYEGVSLMAGNHRQRGIRIQNNNMKFNNNCYPPICIQIWQNRFLRCSKRPKYESYAPPVKSLKTHVFPMFFDVFTCFRYP